VFERKQIALIPPPRAYLSWSGSVPTDVLRGDGPDADDHRRSESCAERGVSELCSKHRPLLSARGGIETHPSCSPVLCVCGADADLPTRLAHSTPTLSSLS